MYSTAFLIKGLLKGNELCNKQPMTWFLLYVFVLSWAIQNLILEIEHNWAAESIGAR